MAGRCLALQILLGILSFLPGSLGDNYSIAGLVTSSIVSCFAFIAMFIMLVLVITWNRWFPRYQRWQGRRKLPRPRRLKYDQNPKQNGVHVKSVPSSIKVSSSRPGSRPSTQRGGNITKLQNGNYINPVYSANSTDHWIQEIPTPRYEEKGKQINFEEEDEEEVIVTEVVTDQYSTHKPNTDNQNISLSQTVKAEEIQMTLQKEPIESEKTTDGVMNFQFQDDDEAVANLSGSRAGQEEDEMILY